MKPINCKRFICEITVSKSEAGERIDALCNYQFLVFRRNAGKGLVYKRTGTNQFYVLKRYFILNF